MTKCKYGLLCTLFLLSLFTLKAQEAQITLSGENLDKIYEEVTDFAPTVGVHPDATDESTLDDFDQPARPTYALQYLHWIRGLPGTGSRHRFDQGLQAQR